MSPTPSPSVDRASIEAPVAQRPERPSVQRSTVSLPVTAPAHEAAPVVEPVTAKPIAVAAVYPDRDPSVPPSSKHRISVQAIHATQNLDRSALQHDSMGLGRLIGSGAYNQVYALDHSAKTRAAYVAAIPSKQGDRDIAKTHEHLMKLQQLQDKREISVFPKYGGVAKIHGNSQYDREMHNGHGKYAFLAEKVDGSIEGLARKMWTEAAVNQTSPAINNRQLTGRDVVVITSMIAAKSADLHSAGIGFQDHKPHNLFANVDPTGREAPLYLEAGEPGVLSSFKRATTRAVQAIQRTFGQDVKPEEGYRPPLARVGFLDADSAKLPRYRTDPNDFDRVTTPMYLPKEQALSWIDRDQSKFKEAAYSGKSYVQASLNAGYAFLSQAVPGEAAIEVTHAKMMRQSPGANPDVVYGHAAMVTLAEYDYKPEVKRLQNLEERGILPTGTATIFEEGWNGRIDTPRELERRLLAAAKLKKA